jgi:small subunit ribosomal protein S20
LGEGGDYKLPALAARFSPPLVFATSHHAGQIRGLPAARRMRTGMANTTSAQKATRVIARRTEINKARRSRMRNSVRKVEEAIASGDPSLAIEALKAAEPIIQRSAQKGIVHRNAANRKVARLTKRVAQLGK